MNDEPNRREKVRQQRLRAALRENLKRRKSQARGRTNEGASPDGQEPQQERQNDTGQAPTELRKD
jgi:hypothetical protein